MGSLCARRVFALVTGVGACLGFLLNCTFFFNPVLSEKHDSQNFTSVVAVLACEASHAVEVAGHAG